MILKKNGKLMMIPKSARIYCLFIYTLLTSTTYAQKLTKQETQIVKNVEKNNNEAIRFLEQTVNINSSSHNVTGVKKVGVIYQNMLQEMGFTTKWIDMPESMGRGGHLVAEIKGSTGKKLLLNGHMDTVFDLDSPFQNWELKDTIATGPGTNDDKGGIMVMLYALKALKEAGQLKDRQIIIVLHGDEESVGDPVEISRKDLIAAAKRSDVALCFESGRGYDYATIARRGSSNWTLKVSAKQSHSGRIFSETAGAGAIYETARILNSFYNELKEEYLTFNPGTMVAGSEITLDSMQNKATTTGKSNIIATTSMVQGDLRFISEEQKESARAKMKEIVAQSLPHTQANISFEDGYSAMPPTAGNKHLLGILNKVSLDLGQGEVKAYDPGQRGAGDLSFIAKYIDCLDGLGAIGGNTHAPDEYIDLKAVAGITKRMAILLYRLSSNKETQQ